jgi:hypothetical protein
MTLKLARKPLLRQHLPVFTWEAGSQKLPAHPYIVAFDGRDVQLLDILRKPLKTKGLP